MNIQLKAWKVKDVSLKINDKPSRISKKNSFNLAVGYSFPENSEGEFGIGFMITIKEPEFKIDLEMLFLFHADQKIDEAFQQSNFVKINAPAIAYPYVRSYISNLTLQSGLNPIILPTVNFVKLAENGQETQAK